MKVAFVASIFIGSTTAKSMPYILPVVQNIAKMHAMKNGWDLFLHTDAQTKEIIEKVCRAEGIPTDKVNFVIHRRNSGMRGMFWRYEAFFMDTLGYDMSVILEGDIPVNTYAKDVKVFSETKHQMMLFDARQMAINNNCICGGYILVRPAMVDGEAKKRLKTVMSLRDHIDDIDYGVDENVLLAWLKKNFRDKDVLIVVDDKHSTFQHIEDVELEKKVVLQNFPGATLITREELDLLRSKKQIDQINQVQLKNLHGRTYRLDGTDIEIGGWWRPVKSEFCHSTLLDIAKKLV